jgi:hypothetical protein
MVKNDTSSALRQSAANTLTHWVKRPLKDSSLWKVQQVDSHDRQISQTALIGTLALLKKGDSGARSAALRALALGMSPSQTMRKPATTLDKK